MFAIYDLNGFKRYNDTFGHPSGDALLVRLAARLADAAGPSGEAFRLGGDEFCLLVPRRRAGDGRRRRSGSAALSEEGEGFAIDAEYGSVILPDEAGRCHDGAPARRRAPLRAEVQPRRRRGRVPRGAAARARGARARPARAHALRRRAVVRGRRSARACRARRSSSCASRPSFTTSASSRSRSTSCRSRASLTELGSPAMPIREAWSAPIRRETRLCSALFTIRTAQRRPDGSYVRTPFPDNIIPPSQISKVSANILKLAPIPDPRLGRCSGTIRASPISLFSSLNTFGGKLDHVINDKNRMAVFINSNERLRYNGAGRSCRSREALQAICLPGYPRHHGAGQRRLGHWTAFAEPLWVRLQPSEELEQFF